ncbi:unnamed protein product [Lasius platythorax]|uniref:Uncharacterized protein n=1 Tax=Lasius platythorax TaxID=488582 RepID=A0AAV2N796_9HYME
MVCVCKPVTYNLSPISEEDIVDTESPQSRERHVVRYFHEEIANFTPLLISISDHTKEAKRTTFVTLEIKHLNTENDKAVSWKSLHRFLPPERQCIQNTTEEDVAELENSHVRSKLWLSHI